MESLDSLTPVVILIILHAAVRRGRLSRQGHTLLYSQLQEGLRYNLAAVSGADSYSQLCIAAKHEEKRLNELARRQHYLKDVGKGGSPHGHMQWKSLSKRLMCSATGSALSCVACLKS